MVWFRGTPALAAREIGLLDLFVFDLGGALWRLSQTIWGQSQGWAWTSLGAFPSPDVGLPNSPAVVAPDGDGRLEVFVATPWALWHTWQQSWSNGWAATAQLPNPDPQYQGGYAPPVIAADADGRLMVFAVTPNGLWRLQQSAWSNGWLGWQAHGSPPAGVSWTGMAAARSGDGRVEVFVTGGDGGLWNIRQTAPSSGFSGWNDFGFPKTQFPSIGSPAVARNADGRLELFAAGVEDGVLYHKWETAVGTFTWSEWTPMGRPADVELFTTPVVAASADGRLELFITNGSPRGNVWHIWQTAPASSQWSDWNSESIPPGPPDDSALALAAGGDGRLELFATGLGSLWHKWQITAGNGWSGWVSEGQPPPAQLVVTLSPLQLPVGVPTTFTVSTVDSLTGQPVTTAQVTIHNYTRKGDAAPPVTLPGAGSPITASGVTFHLGKSIDPVTHQPSRDKVLTIEVSAPNYSSVVTSADFNIL